MKRCKQCGEEYMNVLKDVSFCSSECLNKSEGKEGNVLIVKCPHKWMDYMLGSKVCSYCGINKSEVDK